MKCCIQSCVKNDSLRKSSGSHSDRITFHLFPKDPKQRAAWLESLAVPNWVPSNRTVICSDHFNKDDFYVTKLGMRRLKYGVVPIVQDDVYGPPLSRICKMCLSLDTKMYQLKDYNLDKMYQDITGTTPITDVRLPTAVCWECAARLQSAAAFRSKALTSDALLQDLLKTNTDITMSDIQHLRRQQPELKSSLIVKELFKFNSGNYNKHTPSTLVKTEVIDIPHNEEIEIEVDKLVDNNINIKDESKIEADLNDEIKTEVDLIPNNEIDERDYDSADNSSDIDDLNTNNVFGDNQAVKVGLDNIIFVKSNDLISVDNTNVIDDDDNDDDNKIKLPKAVTDDEVFENEQDTNSERTSEGIVFIEHTSESKKRKKAVKRSRDKKKVDNPEPIVWVKRRNVTLLRQSNKQPYVPPSMPIDETIFTVTPLNHEQLIQEVLERKNTQRYIDAPFKCTICYKGFSTQDKQERHVLKHSEQSGPLKCVICQVRMKLGRELRAHMKRQHTAEFACKLCPLVTRNKNVALGHMKFHAGNKYPCSQCSMEFEKQTTLMNHLRLKHMSDCVCELCGYTFISKNGVQVHKRIKHKLFDKNEELKGPYCAVCEVKFLTQKAYDRHLRLSSKHIKSEHDPNRLSNDPSIKSRRLGAVWKNAVRRRPMIRRRDDNKPMTDNSPITCEQCGVVLPNFRTYATHFRFSHPGINRTQFTSLTIPYMCEHCGKMFMNTTTLAGHMWVHTGQKRFQCDHCNKTFSMKANLAGHMKQHEPVRRSFECRVCEKQFAFNHNLTRHMFVHTGLRPFKCDACEKAFRTSGELRSHVDHVHLKKPRPKRVRRKPKKCDLPNLEY